MAATEEAVPEKRVSSIFDLPPGFFDSCRLLSSCPSSFSTLPATSAAFVVPEPAQVAVARDQDRVAAAPSAERWTCHTCASEFDSLQEQRAHFKSDLHRINVKLTVAGKSAIKEEDLEEQDPEKFEVSSISGSEDEVESSCTLNLGFSRSREELKRKLYFHLNTGEIISIMRCLILGDSEELSVDASKFSKLGSSVPGITEDEVLGRLKCVVSEPRGSTSLRIILLASGGHFAGCVFDGNSVIAHKTFHRYVVRAKSGKRQSTKDGSGKAIHSAGSSLRRYNEAALKKEIQDLIVLWKPYFKSCKCVYVYAPSTSRQMLFDVDKTQSTFEGCDIRHIPMTVHRPTMKEAKRLYNYLTQASYEMKKASMNDGTSHADNEITITVTSAEVSKENHEEQLASINPSYVTSSLADCKVEELDMSDEENGVRETTPLHEAAKSGGAELTLELLQKGLSPCIKDELGRTPYMLAVDKEVRNTFRRFMALNLDMWDWHAANVPSALTKEMEESQAAKQAEKDARRKARAKELKKLKKAKEKEKAKAEQATQPELRPAVAAPSNQVTAESSSRTKPTPAQLPIISKEEERQRQLAEEREKRAAAAERRMAALAASQQQTMGPAALPGGSHPASGSSDTTTTCSFCNTSLAGKVPFHRYNYKYCTSTCLHMHREMLEDG